MPLQHWHLGCEGDDLEVLSNMGTTGSNVRHIWRDLQQTLPHTMISSSMQTFRLPITSKDTFQLRMVDFELIYPHRLFVALFNEHKEVFVQRLFGGTPDNIARFWRSQAANPLYTNHDMHSHEFNHMLYAVPLAIHGDEVPTLATGEAWTKLVDCVSWHSCVARGQGAVRDINFVACFMFTFAAWLARFGAWSKIWREFAWSFKALHEGRWPYADASGKRYVVGIDAEGAGKLLADGYYGTPYVLCTDLDYLKNRLHGADYNGNAEPCQLCNANASIRPWIDDRDCAAWRSGVWTQTSHAACHPNIHPLSKMVPGSGILMYLPDDLHCKDFGFRR